MSLHLLNEEIHSRTSLVIVSSLSSTGANNRVLDLILWALNLELEEIAYSIYFADREVGIGNVISQLGSMIVSNDNAVTLIEKSNSALVQNMEPDQFLELGILEREKKDVVCDLMGEYV